MTALGGVAATKHPPEQHPGLARSQLSDEHRREVVDGSGVSPDLVESRYFTVTTAQARALGFPERQAREGWAVELLSPTGEISFQLKPDEPRIVKGKPVKYETPAGRDCVIDVHSTNHERLQDASVPLWITEGTKKADALTSEGCVAVALTGVWNWGKKRARGGAKYGRPELLPDWDLVPLEGREVFIVFDNDFREKQNVALAQLRFSERLTERGAHVRIVSLPPGPNKGVDDYLVNGGGLEALKEAAMPFRASDLIPYAAKPDKFIWGVVASVLDRMRTDDWTTRGDSTTHSLLRTFAELALLSGRYVRDDDAVEIVIGTPDLRLSSGIGSCTTLYRHTERLVERGYIDKIAGDREKGKANRYRLKFAKGVKEIEGGGEVSTSSIPFTLSENLVPHLRWAAPPMSEVDPKFGKSGSASPEETMRSLGKRVEQALSLLLSWGGVATLRDLSRATGMNDTSKMRSALSDICDVGVIGMDPKGKHGARVWLTEDWHTRLCERQAGGGELARARRQAKKVRENRDAFAERHKPSDKAPKEDEMRGPEEVRRIIERNEEVWQAEVQAHNAHKAASEVRRAEAFILDRLGCKELMGRGYVRTGVLQEAWTACKGGEVIHFKRAMRSLNEAGKLRQERVEAYDNEMFTYPIEDDERQAVAVGAGARG